MTTLMTRQRLVQLGLALLLIAAVVGGAVFFLGRGQKATANQTANDTISVKSVYPRVEKNFEMTVERPCNVEAYYRVDLEARVAGEVGKIQVAAGSLVKKGSPLVSLLVPDLEAAEKEKSNIVWQRKREKDVAIAKATAAGFAVETAKANIKEKRTLLATAKATTHYREQQFDRLDRLWRSGSVDKDVRDEAEKNLAVARASEASADASWEKAKAEKEDAKAAETVMKADVKRMEQLIEVAEADHDRAKAMLAYATVKAPFRGRVVERKVNQGSFIQNASTGRPTPVLTMERTDIVTVVMRVPDNFAPFVKAGTEAMIELDPLPGIKIHGKVTRYSTSLVTAARDRTMRVEVDLWNLSKKLYDAFLADKTNLEDLKFGMEAGKVALPVMPEFEGTNPLDPSRRLLADDYGKMTLMLKSFDNARLIPSQALVRRGGRTWMYVVKDPKKDQKSGVITGKAQRVPVLVQIDDGTLAKVDLLTDKGQSSLTGKEVVIITNQEELSKDQAVTATDLPPEEWKALKEQ